MPLHSLDAALSMLSSAYLLKINVPNCHPLDD
jgi:hypothetical protein